MSVLSIDFYLLEELALEVVFLDKLGNGRIAGGLLLSKLITRKGKDAETFFLVGVLIFESYLTKAKNGYVQTHEGIEVLCIQSRSRLI